MFHLSVTYTMADDFQGTQGDPHTTRCINDHGTNQHYSRIYRQRADMNPHCTHGPSRARPSKGLEGEAFKAEFVVCWPSELYRPVSTSISREVDQSRIGGCIVSVWDSNLANYWINEYCSHSLLVRIRDSGIGGPLPSMLSINSVALAIFGNMSVYLIEVAEELANLSGFPVMVRPLEEDPAPWFRNKEGQNQAAGNAMHGGINGDSHPSNHNPRKRHEDDEGCPPQPPSLLLPSDSDGGAPPHSNTSKEVVHSTDIYLKLLGDTRGAQFIRPITNVKLYPPNVNPQRDNQMRTKSAYEIEGHVDLEIRKSDSVVIDTVLGSCGFLANNTKYLRTEHLVSLGCSPPQHKVRHTAGAGKHRKTTSSATEVADDEVPKPWLVEPQSMDCYWRNETSVYRGVNTKIRRYQVPGDTLASSVFVKYGVAVAVANPIDEMTTRVSFLYRHQIHCWIQSKSGVRGLIVLAANFIPDIRADQPLWIEGRPILDLALNPNILEGSEDIGAGFDQRKHGTDKPENIDCTSQGTADGVTDDRQPEDHPMFAAAIRPRIRLEAKGIARLKTWGKQIFKLGKEKEETLPMQTLMARREPVGWDHTEKEWYYPIWPELDDDNLERALDGPRMRLRLDWGGHDSEASDKSATPQAGKDAQTTNN